MTNILTLTVAVLTIVPAPYGLGAPYDKSSMLGGSTGSMASRSAVSSVPPPPIPPTDDARDGARRVQSKAYADGEVAGKYSSRSSEVGLSQHPHHHYSINNNSNSNYDGNNNNNSSKDSSNSNNNNSNNDSNNNNINDSHNNNSNEYINNNNNNNNNNSSNDKNDNSNSNNDNNIDINNNRVNKHKTSNKRNIFVGRKVSRNQAQPQATRFTPVGKVKDYLNRHGDYNDTHEGSEENSIRMFQRFNGLPQTGEMDEAMMAMMEKSRCGVSDFPKDSQRNRRAIGDDRAPASQTSYIRKWEQTTLTWRVDDYTSQLDKEFQRQVMRNAFRTWSELVPLDFNEIPDTQATNVDIRIRFGRRNHGDNYDFDGKGPRLAHAFPPGGSGLDGDTHFDDDEDWTESPKNSFLYLVALHEFGHALGLDHSPDKNAIMYDNFGFTDRLGDDDVRRIQSLYGARDGRRTLPPTAAPPTRTPGPEDRQCRVVFDHVIQDVSSSSRGIYVGIKGDKLYRFTENGVLYDQPTALHALYPGAPSNARAVFTVPDISATYFVTESQVWKYANYQLVNGFPKSHYIQNIRLVLSLKIDNHRRIFLFQSQVFHEYNFDEPAPAPGNKLKISMYWPAVLPDALYTVTGPDDLIYVITPNRHVKMAISDRWGMESKGYPQWMRPACLLTPASQAHQANQANQAGHLISSFLSLAVPVLTAVLRVISSGRT